MSAKYEKIGQGIVKRTNRRIIGLFIDGTGLDRAARRINRKVDMAALVRGVTSGTQPSFARYYTLIPYEDDSRQRAFLDAIARAGLTVIVKRLPPKGITRQVSVEIEMASDIVAFAQGHSQFSDLGQYKSDGQSEHSYSTLPLSASLSRKNSSYTATEESEEQSPTPVAETKASASPAERIVTVVCPGRDLAYPISLVKEFSVDTITADFGQFNSGDVLKSAAKWIDLSDSETIWMD